MCGIESERDRYSRERPTASAAAVTVFTSPFTSFSIAARTRCGIFFRHPLEGAACADDATSASATVQAPKKIDRVRDGFGVDVGTGTPARAADLEFSLPPSAKPIWRKRAPTGPRSRARARGLSQPVVRSWIDCGREPFVPREPPSLSRF